MAPFLAQFSTHVYAAFRFVVGFMLACHGVQKVFGGLGGSQAESPLMWVAGGIELVGGTMVALGIYAGWAAFLCSGLMASAYFMAHQPHGLLPIHNRGELAALYSFAFLLIASKGSGSFALGKR